MFVAAECALILDCHVLPDGKKRNLNSIDPESYNMTISVQQNTTEFSLFKSLKCSKYFGWYFTHHQQLITSTVSGIIETVPATCRERWWFPAHPPKHVEHLTDLNKIYSVASCWMIIVTVKNDVNFKVSCSL